jgi:5-methylcytosine-specific restriction endonuclease McrA
MYLSRMARALVLNATFEPIGVVSARRALVLSLAGKVDVLADSETVIRSESLEMAFPSVVRLRYFVRVPYHRTVPLNRRAIFTRDHYTCQYCGRAAESIDHVHPRSRGGRHEWENVVASCRRCNTSKGDQLLTECNHRLRSKPSAPGGHSWIRVAAGTVPAEWAEFLPTAA